jgi:phosphatidylglycerophosphatase A
MNRAIATFCFVGYMRPFSGTWGSAAALPVAVLLHFLGGFPLLALATGLAFAFGLKATAALTHGSDDHDPSEVVIDEVVGQWIALFPLSIPLWWSGSDLWLYDLWPGMLAAFVLFRAFDILKPGPIGWADARDDAMGVMLDDVIAGVCAAVGVLILAAFAHSGMF